MRLVHFSDVHMQVDYARAPWLPLGWRRWAALVEMYGLGRRHSYTDAAAHLAWLAQESGRLQADHTILSGDLTAMALAEEFRMARDALGSLAEDPRRFTVIPGNHDVYAPDATRERRFEREFGHLLHSDLPEYAREGAFPLIRLLGEDVAVIGLNSARLPVLPGAAMGWVGQAQRDGLQRALQDPRLKDRFVFVTVHHAPLRPDGKPDRRSHSLLDADALLALLPGERSAVLFGHVHHRYRFPARGGRPHLFGAGSSTMKGRRGYWVYEVEQGRLVSAHTVPGPGEGYTGTLG
jgi:3',5'-cyclic AMP phosphodiesterase CpdA